jgi:hypothetical protein
LTAIRQIELRIAHNSMSILHEWAARAGARGVRRIVVKIEFSTTLARLVAVLSRLAGIIAARQLASCAYLPLPEKYARMTLG